MPLSYISKIPADRPENASHAFSGGLVILGSTGSIGLSALKVVDEHPEKFGIHALAGARNVKLLAAQAVKRRPPRLAVLDEDSRKTLLDLLPSDYKPEILTGPDGYAELAASPEAGLVLSAQSGSAGLPATLAAARAGKTIALANKESLVMAGDIFRRVCSETGAVILPVDSEHNALFQALRGNNASEVRKMILTASGGPFLGRNREFLRKVTPAEAVNHPRWSMGAKISVDSATLMNKGLELIEAHRLFGMSMSELDVLIHPQSVVHSIVEYHDGSMLAQMGVTDMRIPISYCLGFPSRLKLGLSPLDLAKTRTLTFEEPDMETFPCLGLAIQAAGQGGAMPVVLNAADEEAVSLFLSGTVAFTDIPVIITRAMEKFSAHVCNDQDAILELDAMVKEFVRRTYA